MDKSDVNKMPEGMTSEELDALTIDEEVKDETIVKEALEATEESSPAEESVETVEEETKEKESEAVAEEEVDPKDAVIGDFRRKLRASELENARIQGQLEARKELQTKVVEEVPKSPLEIAEDAFREANGNLDGFAMTGELYRQEKAFDDAKTASKASTDQQMQTSTSLEQVGLTLQQSDLSVENKGVGLDLQSVSKFDSHLTRGDKVDLQDYNAIHGTEATVRKYYDMVIKRTLAAGDTDSTLIKNAIKVKTQTKPTKVKTDIDALTTEGEETNKGETETETHSKRLANFICE